MLGATRLRDPWVKANCPFGGMSAFGGKADIAKHAAKSANDSMRTNNAL